MIFVRLLTPGDGQTWRHQWLEVQWCPREAIGTVGLLQLIFSSGWLKMLLLGWRSGWQVNTVSEGAQESWMGPTLNKIGRKSPFSSKEKLPSQWAFASFKLVWFCFFEALGHLPISIENTSEIFKIAARRPPHLESNTDIWCRISADDALRGTPAWISKNTCFQW